MRYSFTISFLLIAIFTFGQSNDLKEIVEEYRKKYNAPGIAVSVIKPDTILYGLAGFQNIRTQEKVDFDTRFQLSSNTKAITATIAAKLVEEGTIEWDTKLLDVVKLKVHPAYHNVTLADLLSHKARVQPFEDSNSEEWKNIPKNLTSLKAAKLHFAEYALSLEPIDSTVKDTYSNGGYVIATLMLERVVDKRWSNLVADLRDSYELDYRKKSYNKGNNRAIGHKKKGRKYVALEKPEDYDFIPSYFSGAGDMTMNIVDYSSFIQQHLNGLLGEDNVLKAKTYQYLHYGVDYYSMGWYNGYIGETEKRFSYHGGSLGMYSSAVIVSADRRVAVVILVNADDKKITELKNELRKKLWSMYGEE